MGLTEDEDGNWDFARVGGLTDRLVVGGVGARSGAGVCDQLYGRVFNDVGGHPCEGVGGGATCCTGCGFRGHNDASGGVGVGSHGVGVGIGVSVGGAAVVLVVVVVVVIGVTFCIVVVAGVSVCVDCAAGSDPANRYTRRPWC